MKRPEAHPALVYAVEAVGLSPDVVMTEGTRLDVTVPGVGVVLTARVILTAEQADAVMALVLNPAPRCIRANGMHCPLHDVDHWREGRPS